MDLNTLRKYSDNTLQGVPIGARCSAS